MTKKEEIEYRLKTKFGDPALDYLGHKTTWYIKDNVKIIDVVDSVWSWIENEIREAVKRAKIEELKKISELMLEYPSKNLGKWDTIMVGYMEERVSELEKEKI